MGLPSDMVIRFQHSLLISAIDASLQEHHCVHAWKGSWSLLMTLKSCRSKPDSYKKGRERGKSAVSQGLKGQWQSIGLLVKGLSVRFSEFSLLEGDNPPHDPIAYVYIYTHSRNDNTQLQRETAPNGHNWCNLMCVKVGPSGALESVVYIKFSCLTEIARGKRASVAQCKVSVIEVKCF